MVVEMFKLPSPIRKYWHGEAQYEIYSFHCYSWWSTSSFLLSVLGTAFLIELIRKLLTTLLIVSHTYRYAGETAGISKYPAAPGVGGTRVSRNVIHHMEKGMSLSLRRTKRNMDGKYTHLLSENMHMYVHTISLRILVYMPFVGGTIKRKWDSILVWFSHYNW